VLRQSCGSGFDLPRFKVRSDHADGRVGCRRIVVAAPKKKRAEEKRIRANRKM
jgi:hypothetical protein